MEVQIETIGPCKKKLLVEVSAEEVKEALQASIVELRKNAILPGFRRGHAPVTLLEKRFGGDIRKEVKRDLVFRNYQKAVEDNKIEAIAEPDVDLDSIEMTDEGPLKYELAVEVWPEFEPAGYEGLTLEKPSTEPADTELEAEIQALRTRTTTFEEVKDEGAATTDFVLCDYTVTAGEEEVASGKDAGVRPEDEVVGRLKVKGIKKQLTGAKAGDTVNMTFKVDKEYHKEESRGKEATLVLNVKGVRRPIMPEATDAWAKELGFESLEELKTVVKRNVAGAKESQADQALRGQIYDKLVEMLAFDLPEDAVRRQQKDIFRRERQGLQYQGVTEEDLAKINDKLEEASLDKAQRDLKLFFILSKIADKEKIEATEADIEMRTAELAARYRTTVVKMREHLKREEMLAQIALQIREEKTVAHILSKAEISEAAGEKKEAKAKQPRKPRVKKGDAKEEAGEDEETSAEAAKE